MSVARPPAAELRAFEPDADWPGFAPFEEGHALGNVVAANWNGFVEYDATHLGLACTAWYQAIDWVPSFRVMGTDLILFAWVPTRGTPPFIAHDPLLNPSLVGALEAVTGARIVVERDELGEARLPLCLPPLLWNWQDVSDMPGRADIEPCSSQCQEDRSTNLLERPSRAHPWAGREPPPLELTHRVPTIPGGRLVSVFRVHQAVAWRGCSDRGAYVVSLAIECADEAQRAATAAALAAVVSWIATGWDAELERRVKACEATEEAKKHVLGRELAAERRRAEDRLLAMGKHAARPAVDQEVEASGQRARGATRARPSAAAGASGARLTYESSGDVIVFRSAYGTASFWHSTKQGKLITALVNASISARPAGGAAPHCVEADASAFAPECWPSLRPTAADDAATARKSLATLRQNIRTLVSDCNEKLGANFIVANVATGSSAGWSVTIRAVLEPSDLGATHGTAGGESVGLAERLRAEEALAAPGDDGADADDAPAGKGTEDKDPTFAAVCQKKAWAKLEPQQPPAPRKRSS